MCQLMGVNRSAYYGYVRCTDNNSADLCHMEILGTVRNIANSGHHSYGNCRIGKVLKARGYRVGRWKTRNLMQRAGVQVRSRKKYKVTTDNNHKQPAFENKLNRIKSYVCDITYIWSREGWLYLAIVIDLFSRKGVVGEMKPAAVKPAHPVLCKGECKEPN